MRSGSSTGGTGIRLHPGAMLWQWQWLSTILLLCSPSERQASHRMRKWDLHPIWRPRWKMPRGSPCHVPLFAGNDMRGDRGLWVSPGGDRSLPEIPLWIRSLKVQRICIYTEKNIHIQLQSNLWNKYNYIPKPTKFPFLDFVIPQTYQTPSLPTIAPVHTLPRFFYLHSGGDFGKTPLT